MIFSIQKLKRKHYCNQLLKFLFEFLKYRFSLNAKREKDDFEIFRIFDLKFILLYKKKVDFVFFLFEPVISGAVRTSQRTLCFFCLTFAQKQKLSTTAQYVLFVWTWIQFKFISLYRHQLAYFCFIVLGTLCLFSWKTKRKTSLLRRQVY